MGLELRYENGQTPLDPEETQTHHLLVENKKKAALVSRLSYL